MSSIAKIIAAEKKRVAMSKDKMETLRLMNNAEAEKKPSDLGLGLLAPSGSLEGNTNSVAQNRISSSKYWCFVLNHWNGSDVSILLDELENEKYVFVSEVGKKGTPHLQGFVQFRSKTRPSEKVSLKKIHWEKCKGTYWQNVNYCTKTDGERWTNMELKKPIEDYFKFEYKDWQKDIIDIINGPVDRRKIYWYWESVGGVGKSVFTRHLVLKKMADYVCGKRDDMKLIVSDKLEKYDINALIIDIPRNQGNNISYTFIEEIQNGMFSSGKYESKNVIFNVPHLIVFANFPPARGEDLMSENRWVVKEL